jgi:hypothetical protein
MRCIFKDDKNLQHAFFKGEVQLLASCRKALQHVKIASKYEQIYFEGKFIIFFTKFLLICY